jgi:hypothetical protein
MYGLVLKGDGKGGFQPLTLSQSGYKIEGNAKGLIKVATNGNNWLAVTSQNRDSLCFHQSAAPARKIALAPDENRVLLHLKNGKTRMEEIGYGSSFLSQSSHTLFLPANVTGASIVSFRGRKREVK